MGQSFEYEDMPTLLDSKMESRRRVLPADSNSIQTAHGSKVLTWMERTGSMTTRVQWFHENHETGERTLTSDAKMVSVTVDEDKKIEMPELLIETDPGHRLHDEAVNAEV